MFEIRIERREAVKGMQRLLWPVLSAAAVLALLAVVFVLIDVDPGLGLWTLVSTSFDSLYSITETLVKTTPIIFTGLAVACGLKMKLWNIGAEGQLYMGAFGATWAAQTFSGLPSYLLLPLMLLSGMVCGALLGGLAGVCEVSGLHYKLQPGNVSSNYGSLGIIVAWLSNARPLFIILTAFLTGVLLIGSESLQVSLGVSSDFVQIIIGLLLACVLLSKFFQENRLKLVRVERAGKEAPHA